MPAANKDYIKDGRYLYADYSPFEENKNFLEALRNFVAVSRDVTGLQQEAEETQVMLDNAQHMHNEMVARVKQFKTSVGDTMDTFHKQYSEMTSSMQITPASGGLFLGAKNNLVKLLTETEQSFGQQFKVFSESTQERINEYNRNAVGKIGNWLLNADYVMPYGLVSRISSTVTATLDGGSVYNVECENTLVINNESTNMAGSPPSMSYSLSIRTSDLEFWNSSKRVSDLGMQSVLLPIGLKTSVSTRLKKSFKFGMGEDADPLAEKEPQFVEIGAYYIAFARIENTKTLYVRLAADSSASPDQVEMQFNLAAVYESSQNGKIYSEGMMPRINHLSSDGTKSSDLLQVKEIAQHADIPKIIMFGRALADKMRILLNPDVVASRGQLHTIAMNGKNMVQARDHLSLYDGSAVTMLLQLLAGSYRPLVLKLKNKSPVSGELILKQQLEGGDRKEYVVRTEDLESMLLFNKNGRMISKALGIGTADAAGIPSKDVIGE